MMQQKLLKSPMNYIGNKYRLLPQMLELFPKHTPVFLDLFCGGLDVAINANADRVIANDINYHLIDIYKTFKNLGYDTVYKKLSEMEKSYELSKENADGFLKLRDQYNLSKERDPLMLFLLMNYSFNYQIRFNTAHEFNTPFGRNRSSWNSSLKERLPLFIQKIEQIELQSDDFRKVDLNEVTFIYADPAYTLSIGSYNDGKRGFKGWQLQDDIDLMELLDYADMRRIKFALSDVLEHKGQVHKEMTEWAKKYHVHNMNCNYNNCNYQVKDKESNTREVLITNY